MGTLQFFRDRFFRTSPFARRARSPQEKGAQQLRDHEALKAQLDRTLRSVAACRASLEQGERATNQRHECLRDLAELESALLRHFALEEAGGSLAEVLRVAPRYFDRAEKLQAQHPSLARELRDLCELGEISGRSLEHWSELEWRLAAFARCLHDHESAENEIASRAFLEDIGSSD
jgi:hypothetical protein